MRPLELWGGVECTVNRVGDRFFDQVDRSGHAARGDDLDRFVAVGITTLRCPVLWERLAPRSLTDIDWSWADGYLARMRDLGMTPIVGLVHHGSGPAYTSLLDERFPHLLARYAAAVAERFPWVEAWTPVNEPLTTARFSALYGHWYPHQRDDRQFVRALLNQLRGVVLAMRAVRSVNANARLVQTEDIGTTYGTSRLHDQVQYERNRRWLTWDLLAGRVDAHHPLYGFLRGAGASDRELAWFTEQPCPPDILGLNYYVTSDRWLDDRLELYPASSHGGNGQVAYADVEAVRAREQGFAGHEEHLLATWERYRRPVAITEVHLGCTREEQIRWLVEAWHAATRSRALGVDMRAVTAWALLGSYDWSSLVTSDSGQYEPGLFDLRAPTPRPTALAAVARELAAGRSPHHPVLSRQGWWRRPSRLLHRPDASECSLSPSEEPPILIVGMHGTLGRGFERICRQRGLSVYTTGRADLDAADPWCIDEVLERARPWAVVNAAGYGRVDRAESDRERCWSDNVTAPVNLAAACRRRGLRLVTFSSDLVFDGVGGRPYTEHDTPAPLNVYGAAKAEAERRVLAMLPEALVVRTSALFSPWDEGHFAASTIRALSSETPIRAADDCTVSPTYVPDLVHAVLDLLIDGERGLWHVVNEGAISWHQFGQMLARGASLREELVVPSGGSTIWRTARPRYSVLRSVRGGLLPSLEAAVSSYLVAIKPWPVGAYGSMSDPSSPALLANLPTPTPASLPPSSRHTLPQSER